MERPENGGTLDRDELGEASEPGRQNAVSVLLPSTLQPLGIVAV